MENKQLYERLDKLQEMMEYHADDPRFLKELSREYKAVSKQLFPPTKEHEIPAKKVKYSRQKALEQIEIYLEAEDIEKQFDDKDGDYYSNDKFIVSWLVNYKGFPYEVSIDKADGSFTNCKCIVVRRSLVSEQELSAYGSFERALVDQGLKLCTNRIEKQEFFNKYAIPFNNRMKQKRNEKQLE